jgi:Tfp pilus assembly protein PilF
VITAPKLCVLILVCLVSAAPAQIRGGMAARRIQGQVRLEGAPAPQGVLILLDRSRGRDPTFVGSGELGNTMTDSRGKFSFEGIDAGQESPEGKTYVVTARYPGYWTATQIADLTASPVGYVIFDLRRDKSKDIPNVPPGGPGEAVSARGPANPDAQAAMTRGERELAQERNPKASIIDFKKVVQLDPQYEPAYLLLGTAYMQTQEYGEAESAFQKATKLDPKDAVAFLGIGASLNQRGNFQDAQKPILHSLELNPDSVDAHCELGRSLWALGKWQEAEPHVLKSLELNKDFPLAHLLMGNIYLRKRDAKAALSEFQEYLRLDSQGQHAEAARQMVDKIQKAMEHP